MNRNRLQLCHVCEFPIDLYLGNFDACNHTDLSDDYKRLHIWHDSQPGVCYEQALGKPDSFEYKEHQLLTDTQIQQVVELARSTDKLFVHCAAGIGRSSTLCVLVLTARGIPPWEAMAMIAKAMWQQYVIPHCPSFDCKVLNQIFAFHEENK